MAKSLRLDLTYYVFLLRHNIPSDILNIAGISRLSTVTILQSDQFDLSTNLFFKINVSLRLVTGELLQKMVVVTSETSTLVLVPD